MTEPRQNKEISESAMLGKMAHILSIDPSSIKKAYEGDKDGLTAAFNLAAKIESRRQDTMDNAFILGAGAAFGLFAAPPVGAALGVFSAWCGTHSYQAHKELDAVRQTVLARLGQK